MRVETGDLHAILEDEFSLFLAVARAVAGALVEATRAARGASFGRPEAAAPTEGNLELIERVLCLRSTLPFARHRVASLVQLARLASEVRADDGVELFRQSEAADGVLLPIEGVLRARIDGRDAFTLASGSVLPIVDAVTRQPRWFSATTAGPTRALVIPIERFVDVLEDQPEARTRDAQIFVGRVPARQAARGPADVFAALTRAHLSSSARTSVSSCESAARSARATAGASSAIARCEP